MSDFDWPDVSYFQAKFGWERVKASKVILNYSKLSRFDKPFGGGLAPPCSDETKKPPKTFETIDESSPKKSEQINNF